MARKKELKHCTACGHTCHIRAKTCPNCGKRRPTKHAAECTACGHPCRVDTKVCEGCGNRNPARTVAGMSNWYAFGGLAFLVLLVVLVGDPDPSVMTGGDQARDAPPQPRRLSELMNDEHSVASDRSIVPSVEQGTTRSGESTSAGPGGPNIDGARSTNGDGGTHEDREAYRLACPGIGDVHVRCPYTQDDLVNLDRACGACPPSRGWVCCTAGLVGEHDDFGSFINEVASSCGGSDVQAGGGTMATELWSGD